MADNFSGNHVQGVFGKFTPVADETVASSADNVQGVFGQFKPVLDEAAGAAGVLPEGKQEVPVYFDLSEFLHSAHIAIRAQGDVTVNLPSGTLSDQDKLYGDPGEVPARDLPLPPSVPEPLNVQDIVNLLNTLLGVAPPAELPVGTREYKLLPSFIAQLRAIQSQLFADSLLNTLQSKDIFYGEEGQTVTRDWTQFGLTPAHPRSLDIQQVQGLLNTLLEVPPVGIPDGKQSTELLPVLKKLRAALKAQEDVTVDLLLGVLLGQDIIYTDPGQVPVYDLSLPIALPQKPTVRQIQNLLDSLLSLEVLPGEQEIQYIRLPLIKALFTALLAQADSSVLLTTLAGQDRLYGDLGQVSAFDWQVPKGRAFPTDLRSFIVIPNIDMLSALGIPVAVTLELYSGRLTNVLKDVTISIKNITGKLKIVLEKKADK